MAFRETWRYLLLTAVVAKRPFWQIIRRRNASMETLSIPTSLFAKEIPGTSRSFPARAKVLVKSGMSRQFARVEVVLRCLAGTARALVLKSGSPIAGAEKRGVGGPNKHTHGCKVRALGFNRCLRRLESIRQKIDRYSPPTCFIRIVIGVLCRLEGQNSQ